MGAIADKWKEVKASMSESVDKTWGKVRSKTADLNPDKPAGDLIEGLPDTPIAGKMTPKDVADTVKNPDKSKLGGAMEKLTGIDLGGFSPTKLLNHLGNKLAALTDMILGVY